MKLDTLFHVLPCASASVSVKAEKVLVCQCKSRRSASASVSVKAEKVLVCQCKSRGSASVSVNVKQRQC